MIKQLQSTRVCTVCGQRKPLVSFLELAGIGQGHIYSDICSTCRRAGLGQKKLAEDDSAGSNTRLQIDIKTKVQLERDKKASNKEHLKRDQAEKAKKDKTEAKEVREDKKHEDFEKKQREKYLKNRNQPATPAAAEKPAASKTNQASQAKGFYQEKSRINKEFQKQVTGQQLGKKTQGITASYINRYVAATGRSADSLFGNLLGQFMRNQLKIQNKTETKGPEQKQAKEAEKKVNPQTTFANTAKSPETKKSEAKSNPPADFLRNNFKKR